MGLFPLLYIMERCSCGSYYEKILATGKVKCIDEEIPFGIPQGWEWCRLRDLCTVFGRIGFRGYTRNDIVEKGFGAITLSPSNMQDNGNMNYSVVSYISWKKYEESPEIKVKENDVLIVKTGSSYGKTCIISDLPEKATINPQIAVLKYSFVNNQWLTYFLNAPFAQEQFRKYVIGTSIPTFSQEKLSSTLLPLPPQNEQEHLTKKLNLLDKWIGSYNVIQQLIDRLNADIYDKLKKSILQEAIQGKLVPQIAEEGNAKELLEQIKAEKQKLVKEGKLKKSALATSIIFRGDDNKYYEQIGNKCLDITEQIPFEIPNSWTWTKLSCVTSVYTGNSISETEKQAKFTNVQGRYYIGTKDVGFNNKIVYNNGISIPLQYEQNFKIAPANSVLMCIEGGSAGKKIAILNQDVCFGNKLCCFAPFWEIGKFIYYYLQSPSFVELFNLNKTGIIGGISVAKVKEIVIPLPPVMEQQRIVAQIDRLFEQLR